MNIQTRQIIAAFAAGFALSANAATTAPSTAAITITHAEPATSATTHTPAPVSQSTQGTRLINQYTSLAGSTTNAQSLITGLRNGTPITLQGVAMPVDPASATTPPTFTTVTFTAPTQPMGWGNVSKALSLAQADLAGAGIPRPTPQQLQAALTGGDIIVTQGATTQTIPMDGILAMRSQGMGWGQIAHQLNLHPGTAFKSGQTQNSSGSQTHTLQGNRHDEMELNDTHRAVSAGGSTAGTTSRMTTASGKPTHSDSAPIKHEGSYQSAHTEHSFSSRIVTATGAPLASGGSYHHADAGSDNVHTVSHVTTASGGGAMSMGENGHGNSSGHGKH